MKIIVIIAIAFVLLIPANVFAEYIIEVRKTIPEIILQIIPDPTPEPIPEPTPKLIPEPTPKLIPELIPEPTPKLIPELIPELVPELIPKPTPEPTPELAEPESSLSFQSVECPPGSFEKPFSGEVIVCINEATGKALKPGELTGEQQGTYVTAGIIIAIIATGIGFAILKKKSSSN